MAREIGPMELVKTMADGKIMEDFHDNFMALVAAVKTTHRKGKIVLALSVEKMKDAEIPTVEITGEVSATIPQKKRLPERLYLTDDGQVSRYNPRQPVVDENVVTIPVDGKSLAAGERG